MNIDIYNNLSIEQLSICKKLNIEINIAGYSKKDYENLCSKLVNCYQPINRLANLNVTLNEYCLLIEKIYELEKLYT